MDKDDTGSLSVTYEKGGNVTVIVRSPRSVTESRITIPLSDWLVLRGPSSQAALTGELP